MNILLKEKKNLPMSSTSTNVSEMNTCSTKKENSWVIISVRLSISLSQEAFSLLLFFFFLSFLLFVLLSVNEGRVSYCSFFFVSLIRRFANFTSRSPI